MGKILETLEAYGNGVIELDDAVKTMLEFNWVYPNRFNGEKVPAYVEGSWDEVERAVNENLLSFMQYRAVVKAYNEAKGVKLTPIVD